MEHRDTAVKRVGRISGTNGIRFVENARRFKIAAMYRLMTSRRFSAIDVRLIARLEGRVYMSEACLQVMTIAGLMDVAWSRGRSSLNQLIDVLASACA